MADQITDGRTLLDAADAVTNFVDLSGGAAGTLDTEIKIQGTGSVGYSTSNTRSGIMYDAGAAQDWSSNHFYVWVNCGIVGLLATKANGGLTVRFCGATVTDWFEVRIAGADDWPAAVSGGWTMFVVDIETARSTAVTNGWTSGTVPATTAIRYFGISTVTNGVMPRMVDNTWMDASWRLPDGTPGVRVEGQNGGTTPWTWEDIRAASETNSWGMSRTAAGGGIALNSPVQFFVDDASTHVFTSTNEKILWEDQEFAAADHYGITVLGAATGTANWKMGTKTGTGDDAVGAQGGLIAAASSGVRWYFDADAANIDSCNLYGVTLEHGAGFQLGSISVETISCLFIDCTSAVVTNSVFLRNSIIQPNTLDGVAFLTTDDLSDVVFCSFGFTDGHAVELTTPLVATQASKGNLFTGFGITGSTDAAVYNNSGGAVTINVTNGGDSPTYRNGTSASTTVNVAVNVTFESLVSGSEVRIYSGTMDNAGSATEIAGVETSGTSFSWSHSDPGGAAYYVVHKEDYETIYQTYTLPSTDTAFPITQRSDRNYSNP